MFREKHNSKTNKAKKTGMRSERSTGSGRRDLLALGKNLGFAVSPETILGV